MDIEQLDRLLASSDEIKILDVDARKHESFNRNRAFTIRGVKYQIEWWSNLMYLQCGEMVIPFDLARIDGTWPHHFKNNLRLLYRGETAAIIPIEEYQK
jgi:hypothetical protein